MTRKLIRSASVLRGIAPLIAILTPMIALAALGQRTGPGQSSLEVIGAQGLMGPGAHLFLPAVTYDSGGHFAYSVVVADVNGDGKQDALIANQNSNTVGVLLGNGDGTFHAAIGYGSGGVSPTSVAIADVNGDHKPDLVVANSDSNIGVLLGNGDGTFLPAVAYNSGAYSPLGVAVADVNGDGNPDLVVANSVSVTQPCYGGCVGLLFGNGDGTFRSAVTLSSGAFQARSIAVADVNGDGKADLVVTNRCRDNFCTQGGAVDVLLGNGDGTFRSPVTYGSRGFDASSVAVADVNGDGKPDLLVTNVCANSKCQGLVAMLLGNGDGTFQRAVIFNAGGYFANWIAVADLNGDGKPDLAVALSCRVSDAKNCGGGAVAILLGYGNGIFFQPAVTYPSGGSVAFSVAVPDVNGDGKPDLVATNELQGSSDGSVGVMLNVASGPSIPTSTALLSSPNPSNYQQVVTLTATVTSPSGAPSGTVVFYDAFKPVGHASLTNGGASISISSLSPGPHVLRAAYSGFSAFGLSASADLTQVVAPTTTTLFSNPNPSNSGQPVTFTAQVVGTGPNAPTGSVRFLDGKNGIGSATLSVGVAQLTRRFYTKGPHPITAEYLGDAVSAASTSTILNQVVQ